MVAEMRVAAVTIFLFIANVNCHNGIPVVIWGNSGSSLSSPLAGHGTSRQEFSQRYLQPLAKLPKHNIVAFLQDKLSLEDLTYHGDVYNADTAGGHLKNLMNQMDSNPSLHLPSVDSPADVLKSFAAKYAGKVHNLQAPYDLSDLDLDTSGGNLILAELPKSGGSEGMKAIDSVLGSVSSAMQSQGNSFTALYTGKLSSQAPESLNAGRHLLQVVEAENQNYTFLNFSDCVYLYASTIRFQVGDTKWTLPNTITYDEAQSNCEANGTTPAANLYWSYNETMSADNDTLSLDVKLVWSYPAASLPQGISAFSASASFVLKGDGYWRLNALDVTFSVNGSHSTDATLNVNPAMQPLIWAPRFYSYHCTQLTGIPEAGNGTTGASLFFDGFQVQFQIKKSQFGPANDCVGFFTIPIWSGLIVTLVLIMILSFGITMIASINTMDRFDDPKGKTITVNVAE